MRLTLQRAKEAIGSRAPTDKVEHRLNRVCERLLSDSKFVGSLQRIALVLRYGQLALPRQYRTVEGIKIDNVVREIANKWYEFLYGHFDPCSFVSGYLRDLGDGHAIMTDLPVDGTLSIAYTAGTPEVLVVGTDADGMPLQMSFTDTTPQANTFATIDRVHKEQGPVPVLLNHTAADATATLLARMEPTEEDTFFHRYFLDDSVNCAERTVLALCKRRHIEFTSDSDILPISNLGALELGLDALQYEAENDLTLAGQYWDRSRDILNRELQETNGSRTVPPIRFIYPGRTTPQFRSTM